MPEYVPAEQAVQLMLDETPDTPEYVPVGQSEQAAIDIIPVPVLYFPAEHEMHMAKPSPVP